jgi:selenide, water dikinase
MSAMKTQPDKIRDPEKRKRVMQRSMRLGHCICDPKKPCPCDLLREVDVCLCAGESLEAPAGPVRLTQLVENAGCASKIDQASLKRVLEGLAFPDDPRVIVGAAAGDDAGVYQLDKHTAIVQTVDVFTPSVDDPYTFGQIAAANSVSDIYAMGGRPLTALSVVGFPIRTVADSVLREILRGGLDKMAEAGVAVIGGHSIKDPEIKAGFAVTGIVDPSRVALRAGARPEDVLILTKPLGTGIIAFASQIDRAPAGSMDAAARSMATLNRTAAELMIEVGIHGCTDVTGFGLMGHLAEMAAGGRVNIEIVWDDLPLLPGVLECVAAGIVPGSVERNRESCAAAVTLGRGATPAMLDVCMDAQTSGGLLIAVAKGKAPRLLKRLHAAGVTEAAVVGKVRGKGTGRVFLVTRGHRPLELTQLAPGEYTGSRTEENEMAKKPKVEESCCAESSAECCCAEGHGAGAAVASLGSGVAAIQAKFREFMKAANAPGALDAAAKQAIAIALSVAARCEPCARNHIRKARDMGFSQDEIDEAAWMAIAFGGSPVMMFYEGVRQG